MAAASDAPAGAASGEVSAEAVPPPPPPSRHAQYGEHWGEGAARCFSLESDILDEDHAVRLMPVPDNFLCPISASIMVDPVATVDGCVYERQYIERWFRERRQQGLRITSPITGLELPSATLMPLVALQRAIEVYLAHRPELKREHMAGRSFEEAAQILQTDLFEKQAVHATQQDKLKRLKQANKALVRALQEADTKLAFLESERDAAPHLASTAGGSSSSSSGAARCGAPPGGAAGVSAAAGSASCRVCGSGCAECSAQGAEVAGVAAAAAVLLRPVGRGGSVVVAAVLVAVVLVLLGVRTFGPTSVFCRRGCPGSDVVPSAVATDSPSAAAAPASALAQQSLVGAGGSVKETAPGPLQDDWRASGGASAASADVGPMAATGSGESSSHGAAVYDNPALAGQLEHLRTGTMEQKQRAAFMLRVFASEHTENQVAIARAGAVAPLIDLLWEDAPALREEGARALWNLARNSRGINFRNQHAIGEAGAMVPLVRLLEDDVPRIRVVAAAVLNDLATDNVDNQVAVAKAGAIAPLVRLLRDEEAPALVMAANLLKSLAANAGSGDLEVGIALGSAVPPLVALLRADTLLAQEQAASTLGVLAAYSAEIRIAIARAGAIEPLVERLHGDIMQGTAALALRNLAVGSSENQAAIVAAGAISPLVKLLEDGMPGVREEAANALWNLAVDNIESQVEIARVGAAIPLVALLKGDAQEQATIALSSLVVNA